MDANVTDQAGTLQMIPIWQVRPSELNPRKQFDQAKLEELAASLKEQGLIEPLVLRPLDTMDEAARSETPDVPHRYEIVAGERRYRAAKLAGLTELPCIVREMNDRATAEAMVVENMQRDDLTPMEEARAFQAYLQSGQEAGASGVIALAQRIGKSEDFVRERLRLLDLPDAMQAAVESRRLPLKVALLLARVPDAKTRDELFAEALEEELTPERVRMRLHGTFIDLNDAPFPLAGGAPSCDGCPHRVFRGGALMLPGLDGHKKDVGLCTNAGCFREKLTSHLETKLGAKILDRDQLMKEYKHAQRLWEEKWKKSCTGCELKLVTIDADRCTYQRWCADSNKHYGRTVAGSTPEEAAERKREQAKVREKERRRQEQHKLAVPLVIDWLDENIGNRDGARFVARALAGALRSDHGKGAAELLGVDAKGAKGADGWSLVRKIQMQVAKEESGRVLLHTCSVLAVVLAFGAAAPQYSSDLPILGFLKQIGVAAPKVEAKPPKKKGKAVTA